MESTHENHRLDLVPRAVAPGLALVTAGFIATSTVILFTGSGRALGAGLAGTVLAPLHAVTGT